MKIECEIIRDLLPLYVEGMVHPKSKEAIELHFKECKTCKSAYEKMILPKPQVQFHTEPAESFRNYVKKKKWRFGWKIALISVVSALVIVTSLLGFLFLDELSAKVKIDTDVNHYNQYIGEHANKDYRDKWGMDESIFPEKITKTIHVRDYKMVYYNPWDAQYLSYLVAEYSQKDYQAEVDRLKKCPHEAYAGYYGAKGFGEAYQLLAMNADPYHGFVYALTDGKSQIIYVELIFCNYFMDLEYEKYIDAAYLPLEFDASENNPYRKKML